MKSVEKKRCAWPGKDALYVAYHDEEWGVPVLDSRELWETLMLEGFQAGLAWIVILRKREAFRAAFKGFDPAKVARFGEKDIARLMADEGIVRSRAKIEATIAGARIFLEMKKAGEDFGAVGVGAGRRQAGDGDGRSGGEDGDSRGDFKGAEEARVQVCGSGDCVCVDAGGGDGE